MSEAFAGRQYLAPRRGASLKVLCLMTDAHGGVGGISQYNRDLLHALAQMDTIKSITVIPRLAPQPLGPLPPKIRYDLSGMGGPRKYAIASMRHLLRCRGIDMLICGHLNLMPVAWALSSVWRTPLVLCIHGIDAWKPTLRALSNTICRAANYVVSVSEITRDRFVGWSGFPSDRVIILPNTVRIQDFGAGEKPADLIEHYGLNGKKVIMTFGRLVSEQREKGFDRVLDALPTLVARDRRICYLIAGDGPDRERLEAKAQSLGVREHCVFAGYVDPSRKADVFRTADVFVMPSKGEGFGIVLLEALACGVPVVGSKEDGTREALRSGKLGILVNPDRLDDIVDGIERAFATPKGVPPGLEYFSFEAFSQRVAGLVGRVKMSQTKSG